MPRKIEIDGTTLEGGGQLVRLTVALSALTGEPIAISKIRGGRHGGGGLKAQHLTSIRWLAEACQAQFSGLKIGSREISFAPSGDFKFENEVLIKGEGGASAVTLILQAILPVLIFSYPWNAGSQEAPIVADSGQVSKPRTIEVTIQGGTNVSFSPSIDYVAQVLFPNLERCGIPGLRVLEDRTRRGWTHGRVEVGSATFVIQPLARGSLLEGTVVERMLPQILPAQVRERRPAGQTRAERRAYDAERAIRFEAAQIEREEQRRPWKVERITITFLSSGPIRSLNLLEDLVLPAIRSRVSAPAIDVILDEDSGHDKRLYLLVVAHRAHGLRLGADALHDRKLPYPHGGDDWPNNLHKVVYDFALEVAISLEKALVSSCVDPHFENQVAVFQALAKGRSRLDCGGRPPTTHTLTARWVVEHMLRVRFDGGSGACTGVGLVVGETKEEKELRERLDRLKVETGEESGASRNVDNKSVNSDT